MFDTLGQDAQKFVLNQTELTTISISNDYIDKICKMKIEDRSSDNCRMFRLKNLICYESNITEE